MQLKKLAALTVSLAMAAGICGVIPVNTDFEGISIAASAASDFTVKTDSEGLKYVAKYVGKGGDVTIPSNVSYVGKKAFENNTAITSVTFPASCDFVDESAFSWCTKLRKVTFEGDADICSNAFEYCITLQSVKVGGSIRDGIGACAFSQCQNLTTVKIEKDENKFWIGQYAFYNCYSLMSVNIPSKCTDIYGEAFLNCFNLKSLTIPAKTVMNEENNGKHHFGYAELFTTADDCEAEFTGEGEDVKPNIVLAGSKTGYSMKLTYYAGTKYFLTREPTFYSPKAITLTVTKGSPAEEWAKENKVRYTYASSTDSKLSSSSSGDTLAAPTGIKASKTSSSITLKWNSISGADAYRVYMYDDSTGEYEQYKDVSGTKCTISGLRSGKTYKFKVAALEESGGKYKAGKRSKAVSVTTK